ncbi:hypothetical protein ABC347_16850 [Sphingomonas sp. 1P06PA]|uniref:hypothetical protein n=1 Tax=Sphingomonas sp. 1P06PA TaxID=554121 RepID=UPI0039A58873
MLAVALLMAPPALAASATAALQFAPPVDVPMVYAMTDRRIVGDRARDFTLVSRVRFTRVGQGYRMDVTQIGHGTDAPAPVAEMFKTGVGAFDDITTSLFVAADGQPGAVLDGDQVWARIMASHRALLDRLEARHGADAPRLAPIRAHLASVAAADPAERDRIMGEFARELLGAALPALSPTGSVTADGSKAHLQASTADTLTYRMVDMLDQARRERLLTIDRATGLTRRIHSLTRSPSDNIVIAERTISRR